MSVESRSAKRTNLRKIGIAVAWATCSIVSTQAPRLLRTAAGVRAPVHVAVMVSTIAFFVTYASRVVFRVKVGHHRPAIPSGLTKPGEIEKARKAVDSNRRLIRVERVLLGLFGFLTLLAFRLKQSSMVGAFLLAVCYGVLLLGYLIVSTQFKENLNTLKSPTLTQHFMEMPIAETVTVAKLLDGLGDPPARPWRAIVRLVKIMTKRPRGRKLSPFTLLMAQMLLVCCLANASAAVSDYVSSLERRPALPNPRAKAKGPRPISPSPPTPSQRSEPEPDRTEPSPQPTFVDICGPFPKLPKSASWVGSAMFNLYFDGGPGATAGCPEPALVVEDAYDTVAYQENIQAGVLRSLAVVSKRHGPVMFYDTAASIVVKSLTHGVAASGTIRHDVGYGDMYLIYTADGTSAMVRTQKRSSGDIHGYFPYTILPPRVAVAWLMQMQVRKHWLWPALAGFTSTGSQIFGLRWSSSQKSITVSIVFDGTVAVVSGLPPIRQAREIGWTEVGAFVGTAS